MSPVGVRSEGAIREGGYGPNSVGLCARLNEKVRFRQFFQRSAFGTGHGERRFFGIRSGFRDGQEFSGAFLAVGTGEMITPWEILHRVQPLEVSVQEIQLLLGVGVRVEGDVEPLA